MSSLGIKKTLNLHKYSVRVNDFVPNWKLIIPVIFSVAGLTAGCLCVKGERQPIMRLSDFLSSALVGKNVSVPISEFIGSLLMPTIFIAVLFFLGLSAYGGFAANLIPFIYSFLVGILSFHMFDSYTLKGLAYCIIMVFPYAVFSLAAMVLCTAESISMSEVMLKSISKSGKFSDYSFKSYYTMYLKNYLLVILAAVVKTLIDRMFSGLFSF